MQRFVLNFMADRRGATAVEYGLIAGLIALVLIGALTSIGSSLRGHFNNAANALK